MCDCAEPDVMTEWTGFVGIEHHYCCGRVEDVRQDEYGNVIHMSDLYNVFDQAIEEI